MKANPQNWQPFALLLIDEQHDFWPRDFSIQFPQFPENTTQLLTFCRSQGIEVIHLRAVFKRDMSDWMTRYQLRKRIPCIEGTSGAEVLPFAQALPGEKVIIKHSFDGFLAPELLPYLRQTNKRFLLTAGLITSTCVLFTTVSAMQNGFLTAMVEDCCADEPARHETTLNSYPFIFQRTKLGQISEQYKEWQANLTTLAAIEKDRSRQPIQPQSNQ
jgi:ureidoacrylate peracid hydrolase